MTNPSGKGFGSIVGKSLIPGFPLPWVDFPLLLPYLLLSENRVSLKSIDLSWFSHIDFHFGGILHCHIHMGITQVLRTVG